MSQKSKNKLKIAIIGSGPTSLTSVITYCLINSNKSQDVKFTIFEKKDKICHSILATGNGRCNFSNANINDKKVQGTHLFNNQIFVNTVFKEAYNTVSKLNSESIATNSVEKFLTLLGVQPIQEKYGMMFPATKKASTIRNCLIDSIPNNCVDFVCSNKVVEIIKTNNEYFLKTLDINSGKTKKWGPFSKVVICPGKVNDLLHNQIPFSQVAENPILVPLKTKESFKPLDGIRVEVEISLKDNPEFKEKGELLFRKYGISGIVVFNLSRQLAPEISNKSKQENQKVLIDFLPNYTKQEIKKFIENKISITHKLKQNKTDIQYNPQSLISGFLLEDITKYVCTKYNIKDLSNTKNIDKLIKRLKQFEITPTGIYSKVPAQATRGGISTNSINPKTLTLKSDANIYVGGEAVDVDGPCGGFNLHWAFSSGMVIGNSLGAN